MFLTIEVDGVPMRAELNYWPFRPGKISGPPEECYPDEDEEIEILSLRVGGSESPVDISPLLNNFETYRVEDAIRKTLDKMQEEFASDWEDRP